MSARLRRHDAASEHFGSAAFGVLLAVLVAPITGRMWRERGQRRLARMMPGLQDISPRERLDRWIIFSGMPDIAGIPDRGIYNYERHR